ncbi:MAG: histidine kinase [Thermoleophilia bacterium]
MTVELVTHPRRPASEVNLMRRADTAGQRLFRELVASRIAWATASEASRLVAVDVVGVSLRATGCDHPQPCELRHCFDRLEMRAVLGNRGPSLPGLRLEPGAGVAGRVMQTGAPVEIADYARGGFDRELREVIVDEEGVIGLAAIPLSFGGEVRGVLHAGLRREGPFGTATIEALSRLCTYAGAALAAAHDRGRVEEVAALRERRRLARALHDDLGQRLFGIGMTARNARESATSGRADLLTQLLALEQEIAGVSASFRRTLTGLDTPTAPAGALAVKVREDLAGFDARTGIPAHLIVIGDPERIDGGRTDALIRAVQEGLRNIERHAQASEVVVTIGFTVGAVEVILQDDGIGPGAGTGDGGFGLGQVRQELERLGGSLLLARADDSGAILKVRVPLV